MIGFFDSGLGGLAIWKAVHDRLPEVATMYIGDQKNSPYGVKSKEEIIELTKTSVNRLFQDGAVIVILACNTASAAALRVLQQEWLPIAWPDRKILGILVPTVEAVTGQDWSNEEAVSPAVGRVTIFATPATIASGAYTKEIEKRAPAMQVRGVSCPTLVPLIESGASRDLLKGEVASYVAQGQMPDVAILGCTHYALIADIFKGLLPGVKIIDQGAAVAQSLEKYLERHNELKKRVLGTTRRFATSGDAAVVKPLAERFAGLSDISWEQW